MPHGTRTQPRRRVARKPENAATGELSCPPEAVRLTPELSCEGAPVICAAGMDDARLRQLQRYVRWPDRRLCMQRSGGGAPRGIPPSSGDWPRREPFIELART